MEASKPRPQTLVPQFAPTGSSDSSSSDGSDAPPRPRPRRSNGRGKVPMVQGEKVVATFADLTYICPYSIPGAIKGTLTVTTYRLYFVSVDSACAVTVDVPLGFVSHVDKVGGQRTSAENAYGIEIFCKDIRSLRFSLSKSEGQPRKGIFETIRQYSFPLSYNAPLFAYQFSDTFTFDGWSVYDPLAELKRLGLNNESWKITRINDKYDVCDTYPRYVGVPKALSDDEVRECAKFRSKGRWPVLSWVNPDSLASICRCAQPLVGVGGNRSKFDEQYIQAIMDANAQSHRIFIMDARPKVNAMVNLVNGGGYENEDAYHSAEVVFLDIHNIHVMRGALLKVKDMCFPVIDDQRWLSNLDNSQWLHHLKCIISGAVKIADKVENHKTSVIVHCSDGWDRTAQLTSLAMLLLDPYYRTLTGFQVLIEKEWLSFGHKFSHRIGHGVDKPNDNDRSPIFLQFIDAVWQVTSQFPHCFEFNEYFLTIVLDHLYSCMFGTFLYNSDKERRQNGVQKYTKSLWSYIGSKRELFLNPTYHSPSSDQYKTNKTAAIFPESNVRYLKLWTGYYCRWNPRMRPQESVRPRQSQLLNMKTQLLSKVDTLKKELDLKRRSSMNNPNTNKDIEGTVPVGSHPNAVMTKYETVNI